MTKLGKAVFFIALTFFAGILWWAIFLFHTFPKNHYIEKNYSQSGNVAIVVLTGGKGRIEKGIQLLNNGYVASCPGVYFGRNGEGFVRFCFANTPDNIEIALDRINSFIKDL